jgi:hypothetical protein
MSPPRLPRKALTAAVLMGGLILPLPARASAVWHPAAGPAILESSAEIVLHWFSLLWSAAFEKSGSQADPDGSPPSASPAGVSIDHGAQIDPDG